MGGYENEAPDGVCPLSLQQIKLAPTLKGPWMIAMAKVNSFGKLFQTSWLFKLAKWT